MALTKTATAAPAFSAEDLYGKAGFADPVGANWWNKQVSTGAMTPEKAQSAFYAALDPQYQAKYTASNAAPAGGVQGASTLTGGALSNVGSSTAGQTTANQAAANQTTVAAGTGQPKRYSVEEQLAAINLQNTLPQQFWSSEMTADQQAAAQQHMESAAPSIQQLYETNLGRPADTGGEKYWVDKFGSTIDEAEKAEFVAASAPEIAKKAAIAETKQFFDANKNNQFAMAQFLSSRGLSGDDMAAATGMTTEEVRQYFDPIFKPITQAVDYSKDPITGKTRFGTGGQYGYVNGMPVLNANIMNGLFDEHNKMFGYSGGMGGTQINPNVISGDLRAEDNTLGWALDSYSSKISRGLDALGVTYDQAGTYGQTGTKGNIWELAKNAGVDPEDFYKEVVGQYGTRQRVFDNVAFKDAVEDKYKDIYAVTGLVEKGEKGALDPTLQQAATGNHATILYRQVGDKLIPISEAPQFFDAKREGGGFLEDVGELAKIALPIAMMIIPGAQGLAMSIGQGLNLSGTAAAVAGNAILNAGMAAITGGDVLKGAITGGIGGGLAYNASSIAASIAGGGDLINGAAKLGELAQASGLSVQQLERAIVSSVSNGINAAVIGNQNPFEVFGATLLASGLSSKAYNVTSNFINSLDPEKFRKAADAAGNVAASVTEAGVMSGGNIDAMAQSAVDSAAGSVVGEIKGSIQAANQGTGALNAVAGDLPATDTSAGALDTVMAGIEPEEGMLDISTILENAYRDPTSKVEVAGGQGALAGGATLTNAVEQNVVKQIIQQANPSVLDDILKSSSSFLDEVVDETGKKLAPTLENILGNEKARKNLLEEIIKNDSNLARSYGTEAAAAGFRTAGLANIAELLLTSGNAYQDNNEDEVMAQKNKAFTDRLLQKVEVTAKYDVASIDSEGLMRDSAGKLTGEYVDPDGNLRDASGNPTGDYIDESGNVYDAAGNPVTKINRLSADSNVLSNTLSDIENINSSPLSTSLQTSTSAENLPSTTTDAAVSPLSLPATNVAIDPAVQEAVNQAPLSDLAVQPTTSLEASPLTSASPQTATEATTATSPLTTVSTEPATETSAETSPLTNISTEAATETLPEQKVSPLAYFLPETSTEPKTEPKTELKTEPKTETETKTETKTATDTSTSTLTDSSDLPTIPPDVTDATSPLDTVTTPVVDEVIDEAVTPVVDDVVDDVVTPVVDDVDDDAVTPVVDDVDEVVPPVVKPKKKVAEEEKAPLSAGSYAFPSMVASAKPWGALPDVLKENVLKGAPGIAPLDFTLKLKQLYPQLANVDDKLLQVMTGKMAATQYYKYGDDNNDLSQQPEQPTQQAFPTEGGALPTFKMASPIPKEAQDEQTRLLTKDKPEKEKEWNALAKAGLKKQEGTVEDVMQLKKGGNVQSPLNTPMPHIPEFITGKTGHYVDGAGDGQSDSIPAMLADGEYVFDADTVSALGNGSSKAGAKVLDKMRENIRSHKRSATTKKIPPPAKSPLEYMRG